MKIKMFNSPSSDSIGLTDALFSAENSFQNTFLIATPEVLQSLATFTESTDVPSDTSSTYSIAVGETLQGQIANGDAGDWYQVSLVAGQTYTFAVVGTGTNNLFDTYLNLRDSAGAIIAFNDDGGPALSSQIHFTATTSGTFFIDAQGYDASSSGQYGLSFTQGTRVHFDTAMGAGALDSDAAWTTTPGQGATVTYGFRQNVPGYVTGGSETLNSFSQLSATQITAVQSILNLWSEVSNIQFTEVNPGGYTDNATILFSNYADSEDGAGAFAYYPGSTESTNAAGDVYLNTLNGINVNSVPQGSWSYFVIMHELGHALGLSHPGDYNAAPGVDITYANNAQFTEDSNQYTLMSYFDETDTGAQFGVTTSPSLDWNYAYTPLLFDIYATQQIYGVNNSTRATDTVYGFNCTAGSSYDFSLTELPALCIWDGGGVDTLDASGYSLPQTINLNAGAFSTIGNFSYDAYHERSNNVSIAIGAVIENAIGGTGNDSLIGNAVDNYLNGGEGTDTGICAVTWLNCNVTGNSSSATITDLTGVNGTDILASIENLLFGAVTVSTSAAVNDAPVGLADNNASDPVIEAGLGVAGDSTATGNVLTNDTDADSSLGLGETKAVKTVNNQNSNVGVAVAGVYGSLTLSTTGAYTYTLDNTKAATNALSTGQVVSDTFTYTVIDAHGATSAPTTLAISITGSDDAVAPQPPVAADDTLATTEDTVVTYNATQLLSNDTGNSLTIASVANGTGGTAVLNVDGTVAFTPDENFNGAADFTYQAINEASLTSNTATVTVNVAAVNDAPVFSSPADINFTDTAFDDSFATVNGSLVVNDVDSATLTYDITGGTDNGDGTISKSVSYGELTVIKATGDYNYVANDAAIEALTVDTFIPFTVTVSDGSLSDSKTLAINFLQDGITESIGNDNLTGTPGNDKFDALTGADTMTGGLGNDTYTVDDAGDKVIEKSTLVTEIDTVISSIKYTLNANVENLTLTGTAAINGTGNTLNNVLVGNDGANTLNGGKGADMMTGGSGNDLYLVDNASDSVTETSNDPLEIDKVNSQVDYELGANQENLTLTGTAILGTGNVLANKLTGNAADNSLLGGAGNDTLGGGAGNDILDGGADDDKLNGGAGNDTLDGGVGNDVLTGGTGNDVFRFSTAPTSANMDRITGFIVADDTIQLDSAIFTQLPIGVLDAGSFVQDLAGFDNNDFVIYNSKTGALLYDADANGGAAEQIALLGKNLSLTHADFVIIQA